MVLKQKALLSRHARLDKKINLFLLKNLLSFLTDNMNTSIEIAKIDKKSRFKSTVLIKNETNGSLYVTT